MPKPAVANTININATILSFKPRQVLLANPKLKQNMNIPSIEALKPEQKALLIRSIAGYLKSNGFSKTLKKFLSEAHIEKDDISESSLDLEHMCSKYFGMRDHGSTNLSSQKVQDLTDGDSKGEKTDFVTGVETLSKKKKKQDVEDGHTVVLQLEDSVKLTDSNETEKQKTKEKRKSKKTSSPVIQAEQVSSDVVKKPADNEVYDQQLPEPDRKKKDKKKKGRLGSESFVGQATETTMVNGNSTSLEDETVIVKGKKKKKGGSVSKSSSDWDSKEIDEQIQGRSESENDAVKASREDTADKGKKSSKKRKRSTSEENNSEPTDKKEVDESKRRKTEGSNKPKGSGQVTELNASVETNEHRGKEIKGECDPVSFEKSGEKSVPTKSTKKQENGSAWPTTAKTFQRVKVEEVVFIDERLKDNSYWAKDGSEIGYGAKAQEVLGQVRGRDFRHEKTKKKRGSYRGGLIDIQSHSVKFNYSDED